jgi:hypothetical protein
MAAQWNHEVGQLSTKFNWNLTPFILKALKKSCQFGVNCGGMQHFSFTTIFHLYMAGLIEAAHET